LGIIEFINGEIEMINQNNTEGDVNNTLYRKEWTEMFISEDTAEILDEDEKYFLKQSLSTPCLNVAKRVEGIYIIDQQDREIMDFHGNSVHQVGYSNAYVINAIKEQLDALSFTPRRYSSEVSIKLAKKLVNLSGDRLEKVLFAPGGSEAISMAIKIARKFTKKHKIISLWDSFHGATLDAISVGGEALFRSEMGPLMPGTEHIMPYNSYRCIFGGCKDCNLKCLDYLEYILERETDIGAILLETIRSTDVQIPEKEYYLRLRRICDKYSVLLILDEIPTALCRTGPFFAFDNYGIVPDMVCIGKGLGGGVFPLAAVIVKKELDISGDIAIGHFTHEKTPVGCAAALATIQYLEDFKIEQKVNEFGIRIKNVLNRMKDKFEVIGDVRIIGMLFAIEFVCDRITKEKASNFAERVLYYCLEKGLSFKISQGNVLTLVPPLTITWEQLGKAFFIINDSIELALNNKIIY